MSATITKTSKKITEKVTTKKEASKLSYYQKKKAIDEIAESQQKYNAKKSNENDFRRMIFNRY